MDLDGILSAGHGLYGWDLDNILWVGHIYMYRI